MLYTVEHQNIDRTITDRKYHTYGKTEFIGTNEQWGNLDIITKIRDIVKDIYYRTTKDHKVHAVRVVFIDNTSGSYGYLVLKTEYSCDHNGDDLFEVLVSFKHLDDVFNDLDILFVGERLDMSDLSVYSTTHTLSRKTDIVDFLNSGTYNTICSTIGCDKINSIMSEFLTGILEHYPDEKEISVIEKLSRKDISFDSIKAVCPANPDRFSIRYINPPTVDNDDDIDTTTIRSQHIADSIGQMLSQAYSDGTHIEMNIWFTVSGNSCKILTEKGNLPEEDTISMRVLIHADGDCSSATVYVDDRLILDEYKKSVDNDYNSLYISLRNTIPSGKILLPICPIHNK